MQAVIERQWALIPSGEFEGRPCQNPVLIEYVVTLLKSSKVQVQISFPTLGNWEHTVIY